MRRGVHRRSVAARVGHCGLAPCVVVALSSVLCVAAGATHAQSAYDVEAEPLLSLRALVDFRIVRPGRAPSWVNRGPAKTRYGGERNDAGGFERVTRFALSQLALEPSASLPWGIRAHAQLNWEGDVDEEGDGDGDEAPRLIEGWFRREWGTSAGGWGVQAGVNNPPFTLDNTGPAWTSPTTFTPSALATWLWEEGRVVGLETEWWQSTDGGTRVGALFGTGWGPDQAGILLAGRGWVLSDRLSGINNHLPLPGPGAETHLFDERDGRPAIYFAVTAHDPWHIGQLLLGYFDNLGDLSEAGVWETRHGVAGVAVQPLPGLEIIVQGLLGKTATYPNNLASTFGTWYPLVSYRYRGHRLSFRYDHFRVDGEDSPPPTRERGNAVTVAYLYEFRLRHRVGIEYVWIDSERPRSSSPDPPDDGWQVGYRYRY
jgi:hypothetical protein